MECESLRRVLFSGALAAPSLRCGARGDGTVRNRCVGSSEMTEFHSRSAAGLAGQGETFGRDHRCAPAQKSLSVAGLTTPQCAYKKVKERRVQVLRLTGSSGKTRSLA
jgi:hypothetical protein